MSELKPLVEKYFRIADNSAIVSAAVFAYPCNTLPALVNEI
jgi:hypothetical protein